MLAIEGREVAGVGTFFGFDPWATGSAHALVETGFTAQQLLCQMLAEHAWLLGRTDVGSFAGYVTLNYWTQELDGESFGVEIADRGEVKADVMSWFREGGFVTVHPVDLAALRRCLYPSMTNYGVRIGLSELRYEIVMTLSGCGYGISGCNEEIRTTAERAAGRICTSIEWDAPLISALTEGIRRLETFDFP